MHAAPKVGDVRRFRRPERTCPPCPENSTFPSDAELRLRGQIAVNTSWANTVDRSARTEPGRQAMLRKFEQQVDPDGVLTPAERTKRAKNLKAAAKKAGA